MTDDEKLARFIAELDAAAAALRSEVERRFPPGHAVNFKWGRGWAGGVIIATSEDLAPVRSTNPLEILVQFPNGDRGFINVRLRKAFMPAEIIKSATQYQS